MQSLGNKKPETMVKSQWEMLITSESITEAHLQLWSDSGRSNKKEGCCPSQKTSLQVLHGCGTLLLSLT